MAREKVRRWVRRHGEEGVVGSPRAIDDLPEIVDAKVVLMLMLMLLVVMLMLMMVMAVVVMVIFHFHEWELREKEGVMNWK